MKKIASFLAAFAAILFSLNAAEFDISLKPFEGVPRFNPNFQALASNAIAQVRKPGALQMGVPTSLTDARQITYITAESLMTTPSGVSYWSGFNPTGVFAGANGKTVWVLVDVRSKTGANDISLSMISAALRSQDYGNNSLGQDVGFTSASYSELSPGWRADGSMVTSGSSSQMVTEVIVLVGFKSYQVASAADVQSVKNYVTGDFAITMTATAGASSKTLTLSLVPPEIPRPGLMVKLVGGQPQFMLENNGNPNLYVVQTATDVAGPYTDFANMVKAGDVIVGTSPDRMFLRYKP